MHFHKITVILIYSAITCYAEHVCRIPRNVRLMHASSSFSSRTRRSTVDSKLKFSVEYTTAFQKHALFDKVKTNIVLPSLTFWEKTLSVKKMPTGNILLERQCLDSQVSYIRWPNGTIGMYCNKGCDSVTRCFTEPIPNTYLNGCKQLNGSQPTIQGERGVGIPPNGYLVFVDASATDPCKADDLLAYALACQLESGTDRPVAGYVNMCPNQLSGSTGEIRATISTFIHEMAHALGFSSTSYAFLRDENGNPRTPRDPQTDLPALGQDSDFIFIASTSTIRTFQRTWVSAVSTTTRTVSAFVLPNLLKEARAHYNCPTLDGMDVENDGGPGTAIVHFEKRITEDELMSGSYSKETYISALTLAYFKDTGWYDVNMSMADNWKYGKNWGCDFVLKSCYEYMLMKTAANRPLTPYCNKASANEIKCLVYDEAYGYCDLRRLKDKVPPEYQYFTRLDGVADSEVPFYGGSSTLSDRCPIYRPLEPVPGFQYTSYCRHPENQNTIDSRNNYALQYFGRDSICVESDSLQFRVSIVGGFYRILNTPSCHKYTCTGSGITLLIGSGNFSCSGDGQSIGINAFDSSINVRGLALCPTCNGLCSPCPNLTSTSGSGNLISRIRRNDKLLILNVIILLQILDYLNF